MILSKLDYGRLDNKIFEVDSIDKTWMWMKAINECLRNVREDRRSIYKKLKRSVNVEMNLLLQSKKIMQKYTTNQFWEISRKIEK